MRIFDETKTRELSENSIDPLKGYLKIDKRFIAHHPAVEAKEAVYKDRKGDFDEYGGYLIYKDLVCPAVEAKDAYDEYEDIWVFVEYTAQEFQERKLTELRNKRINLLSAFDKWEKAVIRGREDEDEDIMDWYCDILDLREYAFDNIPERIKYYL